MTVETLEEMFEHGLEDVYHAEHELLDALEELADQTEDEAITEAFELHREQTETHVDRLEDVFEMIGEPPEQEECEGIQGLLEEHQEFVEMEPEQEILDLHNLAAAEKTEHYEIAAYGNLAFLADQMGMDEAADLLGENLDEEKQTLKELEHLTETYDIEAVPA